MRPEVRNYALFLIMFLVITISIQFIFPFPYGLAISIGVYMALPFITKYYVKKRMKGSNISFALTGPDKVKMSCLACGKVTNKRQCQRCGGKSFKAQ